MAEAMYLLCGLTSIACAVLLLRGYMRSRARLLLWSSICFIALAMNNVLLFVDKVVFPTEVDLIVLRTGSALIAIGVMLFGLVWDSK